MESGSAAAPGECGSSLLDVSVPHRLELLHVALERLHGRRLVDRHELPQPLELAQLLDDVELLCQSTPRLESLLDSGRPLYDALGFELANAHQHIIQFRVGIFERRKCRCIGLQVLQHNRLALRLGPLQCAAKAGLPAVAVGLELLAPRLEGRLVACETLQVVLVECPEPRRGRPLSTRRRALKIDDRGVDPVEPVIVVCVALASLLAKSVHCLVEADELGV